MGIFNKLFRSESDIAKEEVKKVPWKDLTEISQLKEIEEESERNTVVILKHSTRCGISRMVLSQFERDYDLHDKKNIQLYYLDLIRYREVSNEIASRFGVHHESPQLIILQNKEVIHHSSHQDIQAENLKEFIEG